MEPTAGLYRVAPLARLNVADGMATPRAQEHYEQMYATLGGKPAHNTLAFHWARLIEALQAAEAVETISRDPELLDPNVRRLPTQAPDEGIGIVEAPRGTLTHHYVTDERGVLTKVNLTTLPEPKPGEVRVRVLVTSAAFTDVMIRKGMYPDVKEKPPFSPGYDMVGVVDKLGEGATRFRVGQKVSDLTVIGAYSEYICLQESRLTLVPDGLDSAEAVSLVLSYVTAYQMLHRIAKVKRSHRILVHGGGGAVGTAMLQLGKLLDLEMHGTASKSKHELIARLGATPIDYKNENWVERTRNLTPQVSFPSDCPCKPSRTASGLCMTNTTKAEQRNLAKAARPR